MGRKITEPDNDEAPLEQNEKNLELDGVHYKIIKEEFKLDTQINVSFSFVILIELDFRDLKYPLPRLRIRCTSTSLMESKKSKKYQNLSAIQFSLSSVQSTRKSQLMITTIVYPRTLPSSFPTKRSELTKRKENCSTDLTSRTTNK